jgi:aspartate/methionine/tyrosine aminotransferase
MNDEEFAEKLLREEHVAVVPGNGFGPGGDESDELEGGE